MTNVEAIKRYFSKDSRAMENKEILEARKALTKDEWDAMGKACAEALGEAWTPAN